MARPTFPQKDWSFSPGRPLESGMLQEERGPAENSLFFAKQLKVSGPAVSPRGNSNTRSLHVLHRSPPSSQQQQQQRLCAELGGTLNRLKDFSRSMQQPTTSAISSQSHCVSRAATTTYTRRTGGRPQPDLMTPSGRAEVNEGE